MKALILAVAVLAATDPHGDIEAANKHFIAALKSGDMATVADDYEVNGEYVSVRADIVGRKNLAAYFGSRKMTGTFDAGACTSAHLNVSGDTAIEEGSCRLTFTVNGTRKRSSGHYVTVWKYHADQSRWLIHTNVVPD